MNKQDVISLLENELELNRYIYQLHIEKWGDDSEVIYNGKYNHPEKWVRVCYRTNFQTCQDTLNHIKNGGGYMVNQTIDVVCTTDVGYAAHDKIENWNGED